MTRQSAAAGLRHELAAVASFLGDDLRWAVQEAGPAPAGMAVATHYENAAVDAESTVRDALALVTREPPEAWMVPTRQRLDHLVDLCLNALLDFEHVAGLREVEPSSEAWAFGVLESLATLPHRLHDLNQAHRAVLVELLDAGVKPQSTGGAR